MAKDVEKEKRKGEKCYSQSELSIEKHLKKNTWERYKGCETKLWSIWMKKLTRKNYYKQMRQQELL